MKGLAVFFAVCAIAVASGCTTTVQWDKPGASRQDYLRDSYACERDVRVSGGVPSSFGAEGFAERCMEAKGWHIADKKGPLSGF